MPLYSSNGANAQGGDAPGGSLTTVGVGIEAITQISLGAISEIMAADVVFYHLIDRVNLGFIRTLNSNMIDLYQFYGEEKLRRITYVQMSETILGAVRAGRRVVAAFSGHPGIFTMATRRSVSIARDEGHSAKILPAVSSIDCMIADLCIDPGVYGLQILKAGSVLRRRILPATSSNLALLQIGSVGDRGYSTGGFKRNRRGELFEILISCYGADHDSVYYEAATQPGGSSVREVRKLSDYLDPSVLSGVRSGILYLPPKGCEYESMQQWDRFKNAELERFAIDGLTGSESQWSSPRVPCSDAEWKSILETLKLRVDRIY